MKNKMFALFVLFVSLTLVLTACGTANPLKNTPLEETSKIYGFWNGMWDGWTVAFAFIGNLFGGNYGVYQVHNNGNWYDLGFLIGIGAFARGSFSVAAFVRRRGEF